MLEFLNKHNNPSEFEVCYTWDSRVEDGSREVIEDLKAKYSNFKVVEFNRQDSIDYYSACVEYYKRRNLFPSDFRASLENTLEVYKNGTFPSSSSFMWVSLGPLYNKAIGISSGDILVVAPVDMVHLFSVSDVIHYGRANTDKQGLLYKKPNAIWARITNVPLENIQSKVELVQKQQIGSYRWDHPNLFLSLFHTPCELKDIYLPNFAGNRITSLADPNIYSEMTAYCQDIINLRPTETQWLQTFHGFHIMSRKFYNKIGGFTEEYYYRALPDDKMTYHGRAYNSPETPAHISTGWTGHFAYEPERLEYPADHAQQYQTKESHSNIHMSRSSGFKGFSLHSAGYTDSYVHGTLLPQTFSITKPPVRLVT